MGVVKFLLIASLTLTGLTFAAEEARPTRTIARLLGFERASQQQQQQQQQQPVPVQPVPVQPYQQQVPIVYNVKYYDRAENPEVQVEQVGNYGPQGVPVQQQQHVVQQPQQQQVVQQQVQQPYQGISPSTRVFLNLYTGQPTPVYYDSKGQVYVPCPIYDHQQQVAKQQQQIVVPKVGVPEYVYYGQQPPVQVPVVQKQAAGTQKPDVLYYASPAPQKGTPPVGYPPSVATQIAYNPYDLTYAVIPSYYPQPPQGQFIYQSGGGGYVNPFVFVKPVQVPAQPGQGQAHVHVGQGQGQGHSATQGQEVVEKKTEKVEGVQQK
jgi:hypothetical protein